MAKLLGETFPEPIRALLLGGRAFADGGYAVAVLTVDEKGWPHVAMTSGICLDRRNEIRFPLRSTAKSFANLTRNKRVTLLIALAEATLYVKGEAEVAPPENPGDHYGVVRVCVKEILDDTAPGVIEMHGLRYRLLVDDPNESEERRTFARICEQAEL